MIFLHDFVHADLHPGNMIVDRNKSARGNPLRIHMIDCGLTVELGERDHMNLVSNFFLMIWLCANPVDASEFVIYH